VIGGREKRSVDCFTQKINMANPTTVGTLKLVPIAIILLHDTHFALPGTLIFLIHSAKGICFFSHFTTHYIILQPVPSEYIIDALFQLLWRCRPIFSAPLSKTLSIAIEMQTLLQFYASTSYIVY
jgi:hypothetical protein